MLDGATDALDNNFYKILGNKAKASSVLRPIHINAAFAIKARAVFVVYL